MSITKTELTPDLFSEFIMEQESIDKKTDEVESEEKKEGVKKSKESSGITMIHEDDDLITQFEKSLEDESEEDIIEQEEQKKVEEAPVDEEVKEATDDSKDNEETEEHSYSFKALASYLSDQGVIDFEDSEDLEDSPEILAKSIEKTVTDLVISYKESLPEVVSDLVTYIEKGGDPSKYLEAIQKPIDFTNLDLEDESNQKLVLREYLKAQDFSKEEIEEELQDYEDALLLEKKSKTAVKKLEKIFEQKHQLILKEQELENKARQKESEEYVSILQNTIKSSSEFAGLPINEKDKKEFEAYLLNKDKSGLTNYQKELKEDPIKVQLELAYLKFKKYNFKEAVNKAKTDLTKDLKNIFKSSENTVKGKSKEVEISTKTSDLSAFKNMFKK